MLQIIITFVLCLFSYKNGVERMKKISKFIVIVFVVMCFCGVSNLMGQTFVVAARDGDAVAQYKLGRMYAQNDKMQKDIKEAIYWYKKAAEQNQKDAIMALGDLYYYGTEVKRNLHLAFTYYKQASELDNYEACYSLGEMYAQGVGVAKHLPTAFSYYKKAADKGGLAKAMFKVGTMYYDGLGCKKDVAQSLNYIKMAYKEGYPTALEYWNEKQLWQYEE